jgi:aminobenzoyl-glutamate utilization protein B
MVYTYYCDAPAHSKEWVAAGKSEAARESMISGAAVMAATAYDVITRPDLWALVKEQFRQKTSGPGMSSFA